MQYKNLFEIGNVRLRKH